MQIGQFFFARPVVHPIQRRHFVAFKKIRCTDVSRQHALFNQHVRSVTDSRYDLLNFALRIEHDAGFNRIEIHRATVFALAAQ